MLNVGLLGAGRIGQVHAKAITRHAASRLVAVSDAVEVAATALADAHGADARSTDDIIADPDIDAVLIATPTDTHSDLIKAACAAGKAVLCEKPIDLDLERALACHARVGGHDKPVMLGFNRRFDPSFAALKAAAVGGEVGKLEMLSITSFDPAPPPIDYVKVSGGMFRDMAIHDFDIANWIMGGVPESVMAHGSCLVDPEIGAAGDIDTGIIVLTYTDGRMAVIRNSRRAAYGYDQRIELLGAGGLLQAENVAENTVRRSTAAGISGAKPVHFFLERYMAAYELEWAAFVDAATSNAPVPVGLADGIAALAMAEAAERSRATGVPVKITPDMLAG